MRLSHQGQQSQLREFVALHKNKRPKSVLFLQSMQAINFSEVAWGVCQGEFILHSFILLLPLYHHHIMMLPVGPAAPVQINLLTWNNYLPLQASSPNLQNHPKPSCKAYKGHFGWDFCFLQAGPLNVLMTEDGGSGEPAPAYWNRRARLPLLVHGGREGEIGKRRGKGHSQVTSNPAETLMRQMSSERVEVFFHDTPSQFPHQRGSDKLTPLPEPLNLLKFAITVIFPAYCWFLSRWLSSCRTTQPW